MSKLFSPLKLRGLELKNRIFVSPMCQYSSEDGLPTPWHLVHLGSRAVGGAALVMMEATAVSPEGRISPSDMGLWSDAHTEAMKPIAAFIAAQGAAPGVQLAHAGRKASTAVPWAGDAAVQCDAGGWTPIAPSAVAFSETYHVLRAMTVDDIDQWERGCDRRTYKRSLIIGLSLRCRTDDDLANIHVGRLLNREGNGAGDCIGRNGHLVHGAGDLSLHLRIRHGVRGCIDCLASRTCDTAGKSLKPIRPARAAHDVPSPSIWMGCEPTMRMVIDILPAKVASLTRPFGS